VQAPTLKALVRIGHGSRLLPLLALLPSAWLDKILIGKFGLR
jgi:hypothetical protein